jgi:NAD(P)-dependent dehydrogenase (short-subunit alcohol dehydrogenase family)
MTERGRLAGEVAIVTGATSGIGRSTAQLFAEEGASVIAAGRRAAEGQSLEAELTNAGLIAKFVQADVSTSEGANRVVAAAAEAFGRLTIVVNNAAEFAFGSIEECSEEEWDHIQTVNVKSVYLVSRVAIPLIRAAGGGSIVNVSSGHAIATMERVAAYATSKAAVLGLTRQMALDYAPERIRVNALIVGGVDTAMAKRHISALGRDLKDATFQPGDERVGRTAQPREIAEAALFLASDKASFVVGSPLIVDGGVLARLN